MSTMQFEQPRGLASSTYQYQNQDQYSYPQPRPRPNSGYFQNFSGSQTIQEVYRPTSSSAQPANLINHYSAQPQSPYEHEHPPPLPPKVSNIPYSDQSGYQSSSALTQQSANHPSNYTNATNYQRQPSNHSSYQPRSPYEETPPLRARPSGRGYFNSPNNSYAHYASRPDASIPSCGSPCANTAGYLPPPQRFDNPFATEDNTFDSVHYTRDPHKLVAYLVPFPKPQIPGTDPETIPTRFLIYTPPAPLLSAPKEGEKECKLHKVQRKWQSEVRNAKTSTAKPASWQGVKSRATKAIAWGVNQTTSSNLEFLGRVSDNPNDDNPPTSTSTDTTPPTGVNELLLIYPPSMTLTPTQMRTEFVNTMLRTKTKAQRDSIIATGLLPISFGIDIMATLIWPFGGLGEIDSVWLYQSARGAKTASSVTKRLSAGDPNKDTLHLGFTPSSRLDVLQRYLEAECHRVDPARFPVFKVAPTETQVLDAVGWEAACVDGEEEIWEVAAVKEDVKSNMHKGAKEWKKFCAAFAKDPEKAVGR